MLTQALIESLPDLSEERLVHLLEFIVVQHTGHNFKPDNSTKANEISNFLADFPFAATPEGVSRCNALASCADPAKRSAPL